LIPKLIIVHIFFIDIPALNHYTQRYGKGGFEGFCGRSDNKIVFV